MTKLEVNYFFIIELYCKVYIYNFNRGRNALHLHQGHIYSSGIKQTQTKDQVHIKKKKKKRLHVLPGPTFASLDHTFSTRKLISHT